MAGRVTLDLKGLDALEKFTEDPAVITMYRRWGARYLAAVRRRFVERSGAPGSPWKDILPATKRARRKGRRKGARPLILRDTGTLLNALTIGSPGNLFQTVPGGIVVGFGGPARHPEGRATIADIAGFHDKGAGLFASLFRKGGLPKREILIRNIRDLPSDTITGMNQDIKDAFNNVAGGRLRRTKGD